MGLELSEAVNKGKKRERKPERLEERDREASLDFPGWPTEGVLRYFAKLGAGGSVPWV